MKAVKSIAIFLIGFFVFTNFIGAFFFRNHSEISSAEAVGDRSGVRQSSCTITAQGYARLQSGDSYGAAVNKLGCNGSEISRSDMAGYSTVMYGWVGEGLGANMNAMFQNDRLVSKAQFGL